MASVNASGWRTTPIGMLSAPSLAFRRCCVSFDFRNATVTSLAFPLIIFFFVISSEVEEPLAARCSEGNQRWFDFAHHDMTNCSASASLVGSESGNEKESLYQLKGCSLLI